MKTFLICGIIATVATTNSAFGDIVIPELPSEGVCYEVTYNEYNFAPKRITINPSESGGCDSTLSDRYFATFVYDNNSTPQLSTVYNVKECSEKLNGAHCMTGYHTKTISAGRTRCPNKSAQPFSWTECARDCDSSWCHNGEWEDISATQQKRTTASCMMNECYTSSDEYRCKKGYQGSSCSPCPDSGVSVPATTEDNGAQYEGQCYIPTSAGLTFSDYTGNGEFTATGQCWYNIL